MIGWCPSFRVGVAVRPTTYLAFTCLITCSNVKADMWWHSSTITWPYSATKSFTSCRYSRLHCAAEQLRVHKILCTWGKVRPTSYQGGHDLAQNGTIHKRGARAGGWLS